MHLGVFVEPYITYMLNGKKIIESRFTKNKSKPHNFISNGDIVFIKKSCGSVIGYFIVKKVIFFDLSITLIDVIKDKYAKELCVLDVFWDIKKNSRYAILIFIDKIIKLKSFNITKKGMQTWICF